MSQLDTLYKKKIEVSGTQNGVKQKMENKDNRNLEEEMDTASEAKAGEETAEAPRTEETADAGY